MKKIRLIHLIEIISLFLIFIATGQNQFSSSIQESSQKPILEYKDVKEIYKLQKGWHTKEPIPYCINLFGLKDKNWADAINKAFQTWENSSKNIIEFDYLGLREIYFENSDHIGEEGLTDSYNTVTFLREYWPTEWKNEEGEAFGAKAVPDFNWDYPIPNIYLSKFDIYINATKTNEYEWGILATEDLSSNILDIENIMCHEVGHFLGIFKDLKKSIYNECTMYFFSETGEIKKRTLEEHDVFLFFELYKPQYTN